jgi:uncharacterized membrane protein HdeD (DUF308 family)
MGPASKFRRWLAGVCLVLALFMLALGLTVLADRLKQSNPFLVYWGVCACFTGLAAITALLDMMLLRRELRHRQQALIEQTLRDAKSDLEDDSRV